MSKNQPEKRMPSAKPRLGFRENLSRVYIVLMLCIFPLYMHSDKYVLLTKHKTNFFYIVTCLFLFLLVSAWLVQRLSKKHTKKRFEFSVFDWALAAYLFVSIVSALYSPFPKNVFWGLEERFDGLFTILLYGAAFFAVSRTYQPRKADFILFGGSAIIVGLIGILQYYGADIFSLFPYDHFPGSTGKTIAFRTTLGNIDIVSSYTAIVVMFFSMLYIKAEGKWRFFYLAAGALSTYLMVLAGAQAGYVGVMGAFVLALPFLLTDNRTIVRAAFMGFACLLSIYIFNLTNASPASMKDLLTSKWLFAAVGMLIVSAVAYLIGRHVKIKWSQKVVRIVGVAVLALVILLGVAAVEVVGRNPASGTVYEARELMHGRLGDEFGTYRGFIWNRSAQLLKEQTPAGQLIIGSGPDTFVNRFDPFFAESIKLLDIAYDKAHNEYLQILICQGVLGLLSYMVFLIALFVRAVPRMFDRPLLLASAAACASYAIQALFGINVPITTPLFWVLLGMTAIRSKKETPPFPV